jgi:hypothetical protein
VPNATGETVKAAFAEQGDTRDQPQQAAAAQGICPARVKLLDAQQGHEQLN